MRRSVKRYFRARTAQGELDPFGHAGQAPLYALTRPSYPSDLIAAIRERAPVPYCTAVDVGCGSGQLTVRLADFSEKVIGVDRSIEQLAEAQQHERVEYLAGSAYQLPMEDNSADLVAIAQALHWLDTEMFFREVNRILRPSAGMFAVAGYAVPRMSCAASNQSFQQYYTEELGSDREPEDPGCWWDISRPLLDSGLAKIDLEARFTGVERRWYTEHRTMPLSSFLAYLQTMSGYQNLMSHNRRTAGSGGVHDPLGVLGEELAEQAGGEEAIIGVEIPFFLILAAQDPSQGGDR